MSLKFFTIFILVSSVIFTSCSNNSLENPCDDLGSNREKKTCLSNLAIETGNYEYCTLIEGSINQGSYPGDYCLEGMSEKLNSSEPCLKIKGYRKDQCIALIALKIGDLSLCKDIEDENTRLFCVGSLTGDFSVCESIEPEGKTRVGVSGLLWVDEKDKCIMNVIKQKGDSNLCNERYEGQLVNTCLEVFNLNSRN